MNGGISRMEEESFIERSLKECAQLIHEDRYGKEGFRRIFQSQLLLDKLFSLFDTDRDNYLIQDDWIEFLKARLTKEKHHDFVDQIESVAYALCGENPIERKKFHEIFTMKGMIDKLFRLIDEENSGTLTRKQIMEFLTNITRSRPHTGFDKNNVQMLEKLFKQTVGNEKEIRREEFNKIVISKNPFFTDRVFQIFDRDDSGSITLQEFLDAMLEFAGKTADDKMRFLFKVYDIDGDGLIQLRELKHVMRACMEENGMIFSEEQIQDLTMALFADADQGNRGAITFEAMKKQLERHEGLLENLTISIDRWLVPSSSTEPTRQASISKLLPYQLTKPYVKNNYVYIGFIVIFVTMNAILFFARIIHYRQANGFVILARACGQCLNLDCTFILILMLRQCITFLRTHGFVSILPLDHHIYLHKMTGILILVLGTVHTLMHLLNFGLVVIEDTTTNESNYTMTEWMFTSRPQKFGLVPGLANPTGIVLILILITMGLCSLPFVRRGGCFEVFYWSHLLYVPFWIILVFHGPNFWKWFIVPGSIYLIERIHRIKWLRTNQGRTYISSGLLLPSKVTHLVIKRPPQFDFRPGDYVFVNIPVIARYEWHPFTISSAPEQEDYLWLHIRALGGWTTSLYSYFEKEQIKLFDDEKRKKKELDKGNSSKPKLHKLLLTGRIPLEKSFSMPDMETRSKINIPDYVRSESEKSFNDGQMAKARIRLAYSSPQNKSLARSFRYMRTKPTIIAFKTPSLENCEFAAIQRETRDKISVGHVIDVQESKTINYPVGKPLEILLDGPYGAPSSHIFQAQHAVLIATGIGVTPFASILQSIMHRYWKARHTCPQCKFSWANEITATIMNLRKVDFFWINRDQRSFEWFVNLLSQLEMEQAELGIEMERFLEMHMYITSALQKNDMKAVGLQLAMDLLHEKEKRDLITGLKTRTNAGRPNWDKIFKQLQDRKKGKITVFYCGEPHLARILRYKCDQYGFHFHKESF